MAKWLNVTIKRSKWLHNTKPEAGRKYNSVLLNRTGKMCCLGFVARASGLEPGWIRGVALPYQVEAEARKGPFAKLVRKGLNTPTCVALAKWNDTPPIPAKQESTIIRLMCKIGVKARFVD